MPDASFQHADGSHKKQQLTQTALANAVVHLFKSALAAPTPTTPLATFTANECDFDGYAAITIATFADPFHLGDSWALLADERFDFDSGAPLAGGNAVGGWYLVSAAGVLMDYGTFDPVRQMQSDGDACFVSAVDLTRFTQTI